MKPPGQNIPSYPLTNFDYKAKLVFRIKLIDLDGIRDVYRNMLSLVNQVFADNNTTSSKNFVLCVAKVLE